MLNSLAQDTVDTTAISNLQQVRAQLKTCFCRTLLLPNRIQQTAGLSFGEMLKEIFAFLTPLAHDFISAPASQAFVDRVSSVCGDTAGKRNIKADQKCAQQCTFTRTFLKVNRNIIK